MNATMETNMTDETLFHSTQSALSFAFNASQNSHGRPMMNRMAAPGTGAGNGLGGLDGVAQAGMIRSEVQRLGRVHEAILVARYAPQSTSCACRQPCCSGSRGNGEWLDAIGFLADYVRTTALQGCVVNGLMRRAYVVRYFSAKDKRVQLQALAAKHEINTNTVTAHYAKVAAIFAGRRGQSEAPGVEAIAVSTIDFRLREIGIVS